MQLSTPQFQQAPNPPEFAQPGLSRSKGQSFPTKGYQFGCVCFCMAGLARCEGKNLGVFDLCHYDVLGWGCASSGVLGGGCASSGVLGAR